MTHVEGLPSTATFWLITPLFKVYAPKIIRGTQQRAKKNIPPAKATFDISMPSLELGLIYGFGGQLEGGAMKIVMTLTSAAPKNIVVRNAPTMIMTIPPALLPEVFIINFQIRLILTKKP